VETGNAVKTLESWLELLEQRHPQAIDLGLDRCGVVFKRMGSPKPAKKVFSVAGTNGKGSTVAYLAAISGALGQRYGTYTSPHIFDFNERVCIMGEAVSDDCLIDAFERVDAARGDVSLTYFEFTTLAAFLILQQAELDCAILEVGLGGRLDTVNLIDTDCAVITPIGLDHQDFLGPNLASIATEKAGIIRSEVPVVCTESEPPFEILETARNLHAPLLRRGQDFDLSGDTAEPGKTLLFSMQGCSLQVPNPSMGGAHQRDNLAVALAAMLCRNPQASNESAKIFSAIQSCRLPGRLQTVGHAPEIILDVGHNALAAQAVATYLKETGRSAVTCVLSMLADKAAEETALALGDFCAHWVCADSEGSRGQTGEALAGRIKAVLPDAKVDAGGGVEEAVASTLARIDADKVMLVFGSFTTVSAAAHYLQNRLQRDTHDAAKIS
jgi:dihydrofolate synthase/folylpolyglutamate synthase